LAGRATRIIFVPMTGTAAAVCRKVSGLSGRAIALVALAALTLAAGPAQAGGAEAAVQANTPPSGEGAAPGPAVLQQPAEPEVGRCGGVDLVQALKASDPKSFEKFEDAARSVVNGQGLLWRVERPGGKVSYLFGTMHSSEPLAKRFDDLVIRALARARVVAIELPGATTRRGAAELTRLVESRSFRAQGDTLERLPEDVRTMVEQRLAQNGVPPSLANQLQPWYLALKLPRAPCLEANARPIDPETADARIERMAREQGSRVVALETAREQADALASVPDEVALRMLSDAARKRLNPEDVDSTIYGLYSSRRIGYLLAMRGPTWAGIFDVDAYAEYLSAFITQRNAKMLQRALPILNSGEAFLAVGALHLPGERGLVELIRRSGYLVTRLW
jgi:uncharacterized protein YbaP (TraB family)